MNVVVFHFDSICIVLMTNGASLVAQSVKNLPVVPEMGVRSLGWEDPWRKKWQRGPGFLSEKSYRQRSLVGYSPWGRKSRT